MRFELFQDAADGDDRALDDLDTVLRRVEMGVHELVFDDPAAIEQSRWFRWLRPHSQQLIRLLIEAQVWPVSGRPSRIFIRNSRDASMARDAASSPLVILVENDASDGSLVIAAVLAHASAETIRVWDSGSRAAPPGWLIESCGGTGEMPRRIREHGADKRRVIIVCDSDRYLPDAAPKSTVKNCEDAARASKLRAPLILPLREAENYLPNLFWELWLDEDRARVGYNEVIEALKALTSDQRDHINMSGDVRLVAGPAGPLFDGTDVNNPAPERKHLNALIGLKKNLKGSGKDPKTGKSRMPIRHLAEFVRSRRVTAADLDQRDRAATLKELVQIIAEEL